MTTLIFVGTIGDLRQRLQLCRARGESIVTYAQKHGPRVKIKKID